MKITEQQLKQIIQEEIDQTIEEGWLDRLRARASGGGKAAGAAAQRLQKAGEHVWTWKGTGEAPGLGGTYTGGKAEKIMTLYKNKTQKMINSLFKDLTKLGLDAKYLGDVKGAFAKMLGTFDAAAARLGQAGGEQEVVKTAKLAAAGATAPEEQETVKLPAGQLAGAPAE